MLRIFKERQIPLLLLLLGLTVLGITVANPTQITQATPQSTNIMPIDSDVLALFTFAGTLNDVSGNDRHATLIGGSFATVGSQEVLVLQGLSGEPQGFDWSTYANLLTHPYTIEMILTPDFDNIGYQKLFSYNDSSDSGWYIFSTYFAIYPYLFNISPGSVSPNNTVYVAFVSTSDTEIDVYVNGIYAGSSTTGFTAPPSDAIFFNDDSATSRGEQFIGNVDEVRISSIARTPAEIYAIQAIFKPFTVYLPNIVR